MSGVLNMLTEEDYEFLIEKTKEAIRQVPFFVRPLAPDALDVLRAIPERLRKYTVNELIEAYERALEEGRLPRRL